MKIIADAQVFQTSTWHRGMGKYSFELLKALEQQGYFKNNPLTLLLNSNLKLDTDRKELIDRTLPNAKVVELNLLTTNALNLGSVQKHNEEQLNTVFKGQDELFLIPSLFENEVTPVFPKKTRKVVLGYDLIPLLFYDRYLAHSEPLRNNYFGRFKTIFDADHIFTISQTTSDDYSRQLGLPLNMLTNIDGARIGLSESDKKPTYVPKKKYILSSSGDDIRKNNERMVKAFAEFNKESGQNYELLITSNFSRQSQQVLNRLSSNIKFVGNVDDEELQWYYNNTEALLFVPEYEGLGLPVLEAVESGKKVICSDIAVFREMVKKEDTFYLCEPYDVDSIKNSIERAIQDKSNAYTSEYSSIKEKYTWARTAKVFSDKCNDLKPTPTSSSRKKIAVVSPHPGGKSAIGKVIEASHFELSRLADVEYFFEVPKEDVANLKGSFIEYMSPTDTVYRFNADRAKSYDEIIYHLGSSTYHIKSIVEALAIPGTVILHDTRFEGAYSCLVTERMISQQRLDAERLLDKLLDIKDSADHIISLVNESNKIVVHSNFAGLSVKRCLTRKRQVEELGLPIGLSRKNDHFRRGAVKIAMAGIISKAKGFELLISLLESRRFNQSTFLLFGYDFAIDDRLLNNLSHHENLKIMRNLSDLEFRQQLKEADILLNYRDYYHGETSYATLEAMREGVVPIVRDIGWFSELPDEAVRKVTAAYEVGDVLEELITDRAKLSIMSQLCYEYTVKQHSPADYARNLVKNT